MTGKPAGEDGETYGTASRVPKKSDSAAPAVFLILIALLVAGSGCLFAARQPDTGSPTAMAPGNGSPGYFLYQNIVNTSEGGSAGLKTAGTVSEDVRAAAIQGAMDSRNPVTRDFAVSLIPQRHGGPFSLAQICDLWEAVYSRWTYVEDPHGSDYFSPASRTIAVGLKGDCDDFAIAVAAMIESVGGDARIISAWNNTSGHAYPEVYIGTTEEEFNAAAAYIRHRYKISDVGCHITNGTGGPRYWLNLDWWSRYPGGKFYADDGIRTAYYPDGHWERVEQQEIPAPRPGT